jgi:hypothetical protein
MAKVLIPNIFITNRYDTIKEFFLNPEKKFTTSELPSSDGSLLITPKKNKYLQSFDYSFNYSQQSKGPLLVLEFVDTDGKFEEEFLIKPYDALKSQIHSAINKNNEAVEAAVSKLKEINRTEIVRQLEDLNSLFAIVDRIYVSFGEGTDLGDWSDPLAFTVIGRKIDVPANGLKKYKFTFVPSVNALFRPRLKFNQESPNPEREFFFLDNSYVSIGGLIPYFYPRNYDTINILYNLLEDYISKITLVNSRNIIGILPQIYENNGAGIGNFGLGIENALENLFNIKVVTAKEYSDKFSDISKKVNTSPPLFGKQVSEEYEQRKNSNKFYSITADILDTKINPKLPNWQSPFDKINVGLKSLLNLSTDNDFTLIQETNVRLLKFWQELGLIQDASKPCIIFGPERMIYEWLHVMMIPGETDALTAAALEEVRPSVDLAQTLNDNDRVQKIYNILNDSTYKLQYASKLKKNKSSSLFKEKIIVDEFALKSKNNFISEYFNTNSKLAELLDIPVFTNNIKNSNVLDIQLQNDEVYFNSIRIAIEKDYAKYFLTQISENIKNISIKGINIGDLGEKYNFIIRRLKGTDRPSDEFNVPFDPVSDFEIVKKILIQQLYIAKRDEIQFKNIDDLLRLQIKRKLIPYTTDIEFWDYPDPTNSREQKYRLQTPEDIEKEIIDKVKIDKFYKISEYRDLLLRFNFILESFGRLMIKDPTSLDFTKLLIAYAAYASDLVKVNFNSIESSNKNINENFKPIEKLEEYFKYATLMMNMFVIPGVQDVVSRNQIITFKPKDFGLSQSNLLSELASHISNNAYLLNIKTLPFFQISTYKDLFYKPCILLSKKVLLESPVKSSKDDSDFFTGVYNILGFRHVITTRDCYSQFLLYKNTIKAILN